MFLSLEPLYTSQSGNDKSGDGSEGKPFETILRVGSFFYSLYGILINAQYTLCQ